MTYDNWKTTNPADAELGPEPMSDDDCEDQACSPTEVCTLFPCQRREVSSEEQNAHIRITTGGEKRPDAPWRPRLVKRGRYWCCPTCGSSYGENPHPDLH